MKEKINNIKDNLEEILVKVMLLFLGTSLFIIIILYIILLFREVLK